MAKKPVPPGGQPTSHGPTDLPTPAHKAVTRARLVAKGVPFLQAEELAGVGEALTAQEIDDRRIAWQKTLPKA